MKHYTLILVLLTLSGCQDIVEGSQDISHTVRRDVTATAADVRELFTYRRKEPYSAIPYTFCYQMMMDIICYDRPLEGSQHRLVGWQGRPGPQGEIVINSPLPGDVEPVEVSRMPANEAGKKAGNLTPLTPIFVDSAPAVKEEGTMVKVNESPDALLY